MIGKKIWLEVFLSFIVLVTVKKLMNVFKIPKPTPMKVIHKNQPQLSFVSISLLYAYIENNMDPETAPLVQSDSGSYCLLPYKK